MKQRLLLLLVGLMAVVASLPAAALPQVTAKKAVWRVIRFFEGGGVLTAQGEGLQAKTAMPTGNDAQLWRLEGNDAQGYILVNKQGQRLYMESLTAGGRLMTAASPATNTLFSLSASGHAGHKDAQVLSPKAAPQMFVNQFGGSGIGIGLALYTDRADANSALCFVDPATLATAQQLPLIPYPASVETRKGTLHLGRLTAITYPDDEVKVLADLFADRLKAVSGIALAVEVGGSRVKSRAINLVRAEQTGGDEAYTLTVDRKGVTITAQARAGFFYALQTLRQLLPPAIYGTAPAPDADWQLPYVAITDAPLMKHRGFMLDIARHFFTKDEVKKLLDAAATYKLNRFHWHLTDDQGWRVEIPEYPKLTTVGAVRRRSLKINDPSRGLEFYDNTEYGRGLFYTLDDLREIVDYAKALNIEIIPEVDLPGHMVAAVTAYPELSCNPDRKYEVRSEKGVSTDVLNVGDDKVIDFLKCVLGHIATVFPYRYVHIGGDECPTTVWVDNAACQQRIKDEGLRSVNDLQPWLVEELGAWLKATYGKDVVVWDELLAHWNDNNTVKPVVMAWRGNQYTAQAAERGLSSISVPVGPFYFDLLQAAPSQWRVDEPYMGGYGDGSVNSIDRVYAFNPLSNVPGKEQYVIGTQANLWTESCGTALEAEYQLYPRLLALSEVAWLPVEKKNYVAFYRRLQQNVKILDALGITYGRHYIEPPVLTPAQAALAEADALLAQSHPGAVGYPAQADYDRLQAARNAVAQKASPAASAVKALTAAIAAYKAADIVRPEAGRIYRILSASTYTRNRYNGSSLYADGNRLGLHYTPQAEPEELWRIVPQANGSYTITSVLDGRAVAMPAYNAPLELAAGEATAVRFDVPAKPNADYTYVPGTMTISAAADHTAGSVRRFYATMSAGVVAYDSAMVSSPATWRVEEVSDYALYLKGLHDKCVRIITNAAPGAYGEPTAAALRFLQTAIVAPAADRLAQGHITADDYAAFLGLYNQFLAMPRPTFLDTIDETVLYRIVNAHHTTRYACAANGKVESHQGVPQGNGGRWVIRKNADGTVALIDAADGRPAGVAENADGQAVAPGLSANAWTLVETTTDQGLKGIAIVDASGTYSWYTNPGTWQHVLLKPRTWGAGIWRLEKLNEPVPAALTGSEAQ